jgi:hypothetical protein
MLIINGVPSVTIAKRDGTVFHALLDRCDYPEAIAVSWHMAGGKGHAGLYATNPVLGYMHRWVARRMGILTADSPKSIEIDHIDGDRLNNQRDNLRPASRPQNIANSGPRRGTSRFKGVSWAADNEVWQAHIGVSGRSRFLGFYEVEEDAASAYDIAAAEAYGEFARFNFPDRLGGPAPARFSAKMTGRVMQAPPPAAPDMPSKQRLGSANGRAKLTESDVTRIIDELRVVPRRSQESIAEQFKVSRISIARIARRESWAHLWE